MRRPADTLADLWIERTRASGIPQFRLFCFPYAGGGTAIFRDWAKELGLNVEVCAIRLPGRERRFGEAPMRRSEQIVAAVVPILRDLLDLPFAMFGHSMGAVLAYEVARALRAAAAAEPRLLVVSAHNAPQSPPRHRNWHTLPRDALIAQLKALNGTPPEIFEHDDLVDLMLPMLRGDLELIETYQCAAGPLLTCPVLAIGGADDADVPSQELAGWASVTTGSFKPLRLPGGHFFITTGRTGFLQTLRRELVEAGFRERDAESGNRFSEKT
jgi:medium-chain acyl-[acyl-carrier-protein] hydrolase